MTAATTAVPTPSAGLPADELLERATLASLIHWPPSARTVLEELTEEHFALPRHHVILRAVREMATAGIPIDIVTLHAHLAASGQDAEVGGAGGLMALWDTTPTAVWLEHYARMLEPYRIRRSLWRHGAGLADAVLRETDSPDALLSMAEDSLAAVSAIGHTSMPQPIGNVILAILRESEEAQATPGRPDGVPTGFPDLDEILGGLQPGHFVIVAGRPGMGKTALALDVAMHASSLAIPTLFLSYEMTAKELVRRRLSTHSGVGAGVIRRGSASQEEWQRLQSSAAELHSSTITLLDGGKTSLSKLCRVVRAWSAVSANGLVVLDYIQLVKLEARYSNRQEEVATISRTLKLLAMECQVPVLALSQLSRALEAREDKRPVLSDLRESGALEQDADAVLFVFRNEVYSKSAIDAGKAEIIIAKHRHGQTGVVNLQWRAGITSFAPIREWQSPSDRDDGRD